MLSQPKLRNIVSTAGTTRDFIAILKRLTGASPADILAVRLIIEPQAAAAVVSSASGADIKLIREAHENAVNAEDLASFERWDAELHSRIYTATRNELLISLNDLLGDIRNRTPWIRLKKKVITEAKRREYCGHHEKIVQAIAGRDSDAASESMHRHISIIIEDLFPQ
ncbi:MAG: hypothetical protein CL534_10580 [Ahrensia sp.]|nr:hypothetical protein [Ahrensia sp.]